MWLHDSDGFAYCTDDSDLVRLLIDDWIAYCTDDSDLVRSLVYKGLRRSRESPKLDLVSNLSPVETFPQNPCTSTTDIEAPELILGPTLPRTPEPLSQSFSLSLNHGTPTVQ